MSARALGLCGGYLVDGALGDPVRGHPVALFGALADRVEQRTWRDSRTVGVAYAAALVATPAAATALIERRLGRRGRVCVTAAAVWTALGARSLGREALAVAQLVADDDLEAARGRLPALVGRDPSGMPADELCRAAVESVAENTADAVVAPLLFAAALGAPGVVAHRCANTLDAMVGHRTPRHERFGWAAARLDDILAWLPARLSAALAVALAPLVGGSQGAALATWRRDGRRHPSPNAGRVEAAFAGALGVRLGGENRYGDRVEVRGPLGDGPAPTPADVRRAVRLSRAVGLASALLAGGLAALPARSRGVAA